MNNHEIAPLEQEQFEFLIQGLQDNEYAFCDSFLDANTVAGLRANLLSRKEEGLMHPAGVGRKFDFQKNTMVRGDVISWIEKETTDPFERIFLDKVGAFIRYLNSTCFTSINDCEFHYAYYEENSFYRRHLDQFRSDRGRKFSLVTYLNDNWHTSDDGQLILYPAAANPIDIYPLGGRAVFFRSDQMEHEVRPSANRYRISIAGWLKSA